MNTNIENIRLKSGEEYPVSPAYFDGIIVPFEADFSSAERATISIDMGDDPIEMGGVKISNQVISMETLQKYAYGKVNVSIPVLGGEKSFECPIMQIFENLQDMIEFVSSQFAMFDIHSVPGYGAFFYPEFGLIVATEAGTFRDTLGVVTITIPSVGTYMMAEGNLPPVGTLNGELHFGEYHIPEGYLQTNRAVEELYPVEWTYGEELSLFANPILYAAFNRAYRARKPIRLHMNNDTETFGDLTDSKWRGSVFYNSSSQELCREVVEFTPKEDMSVPYVPRGSFFVDIDAEVYEEKTKGNLNELTFTFDGTDWTLDGNTATLSDYGITLDGSPAEGDSLRTQLHGDSWKIGYEVICTIPQA